MRSFDFTMFLSINTSRTQKAIPKIIDQARCQVQDEPEKKDGKVVTRL